MLNYPSIYLAISILLGIILQRFTHSLETNFLILLFFVLIVLIAYLVFIQQKINYKITSCIFLTTVLSFSYTSYRHTTNITYPLERAKVRGAKVVGNVKAIDLIKDERITFEVEINKIDSLIELDNNNLFLCTIWKDTTKNLSTLYSNLRIGNKIELKGTISKPKNDRNPGEFNYSEYLSNKGISGIINCYKPGDVKTNKMDEELVSNFILSIRQRIDNRIKTIYDSESSALLKGILLADRSDINYDIKNSFINSGVIHVLAVSGLHVGFISTLLFLILGRTDIRLKYALTILGIVIFLILTGSPSSVFRASIMAIVYLVTKLANRSTNGYNSLALAAIILLIIDPNELFNPGFQLSFSAVLSILIIYPIISNGIKKIRINKIGKNIILFSCVSLAAQVGTLPFTVIYFNKLSLISLFANIIVIPVIGIIVSIGILSLLASLISIFGAGVFAAANMLIINLLYFFISTISKLSFSYLPIYNFSLIDGIIFYLLTAITLYSILYFRNKVILLFTIVFIALGFNQLSALDNNQLLPKGNFSIMSIDIGQGDSFLLKFPNDVIALIDAGNSTEYFDKGERVIIPLLNRLGIDKLDYTFITHLDSDHFAGSISIINNGYVENIYKPKDEVSIKDSIFEDMINSFNLELNYYSTDSFELGGCKVYILNDTSDTYCKEFDSNNKSGILKIVYGSNSFLFVGDAELEAEEYLISKYDNFLKADVLKIGHHGSGSSSSPEFLDKVDPDIGIISAGLMNKFNHPSPKVITRLQNREIKIFRTDREGAVILTSDGSSISKIDWR